MDLEKLKNRDFVLVIDKSGSMSTKDTPNGKSRWMYAKESTLAIVNKVVEFDPDGIQVVTFAGSYKKYDGVKDAGIVDTIWNENEPNGGTTLAPVLAMIFADYAKRKKDGFAKANGEMLLVITDGQPEDEAAVAKEIVKFGNGLANADEEYGISFLQVGKDTTAAAFLKKLDDDLTAQGAKYDIVDTKTMEEIEKIGLTETLIAALVD